MTGYWVDHGDGYQSCKVGQHVLEIKRNPDPHDKRRYYAYVSGEEIPTPTWSPSQAKTKAIKAMERGYITVRTPRRQDTIQMPELVPELDLQQPTTPQPSEQMVDMVLMQGDQQVAVCETKIPDRQIQDGEFSEVNEDMDQVRFVIKGHFDLNSFSGSMSALNSAVELLRELGPTFCDVYPPSRISI